MYANDTTGGTTSAQWVGTTISVLTCPSDPPDTAGANIPALSYVVNRGRNGWNWNAAVGVCFDQAVQYEYTTANPNPPPATIPAVPAPAKVSMDYLTSHDGSSNTLLLAESLLTPQSNWGATKIASGTTTLPVPSMFLVDGVYPVVPAANSMVPPAPTVPGPDAYFLRPYCWWVDNFTNVSTAGCNSGRSRTPN